LFGYRAFLVERFYHYALHLNLMFKLYYKRLIALGYLI